MVGGVNYIVGCTHYKLIAHGQGDNQLIISR